MNDMGDWLDLSFQPSRDTAIKALRVHRYRADPPSMGVGVCGTIPDTGWYIDEVLRLWGGGRYRVYAYDLAGAVDLSGPYTTIDLRWPSLPISQQAEAASPAPKDELLGGHVERTVAHGSVTAQTGYCGPIVEKPKKEAPVSMLYAPMPEPDKVDEYEWGGKHADLLEIYERTVSGIDKLPAASDFFALDPRPKLRQKALDALHGAVEKREATDRAVELKAIGIKADEAKAGLPAPSYDETLAIALSVVTTLLSLLVVAGLVLWKVHG